MEAAQGEKQTSGSATIFQRFIVQKVGTRRYRKKSEKFVKSFSVRPVIFGPHWKREGRGEWLMGVCCLFEQDLYHVCQTPQHRPDGCAPLGLDQIISLDLSD